MKKKNPRKTQRHIVKQEEEETAETIIEEFIVDATNFYQPGSQIISAQVVVAGQEAFIIRDADVSQEIQCAKCDMAFKTEVWYKKHLVNYHGVDLSNVAHFLANLQPADESTVPMAVGGGGSGGDGDQILNELLNEVGGGQEEDGGEFEELNFVSVTAVDAVESFRRPRTSTSSSSKDPADKKRRVERISFDTKQKLKVDPPLLRNPFVVQYLANETKAQPAKLEQLMKQVQKSNKENQREEIEFHESQVISLTENGHQKFGCSLCGTTFTKRFSVAPHILRVHMRKKDKICPYCNRAFSQTGDLTRHIRTHTGLKPFKCDAIGCNLSFISSGDMVKHQKRHQAEGVPKPHVCDICNQAFERNYDLTRHKLRHEMDLDPNLAGFRCEICQKRFARKGKFFFESTLSVCLFKSFF